MQRRFFARRLRRWTLVVGAVSCLVGCGAPQAATEPTGDSAEASPVATELAEETPAATVQAEPPAPQRDPSPVSDASTASAAKHESSVEARETWDVIYLQGARVGYIHTQYRPDERDGDPVMVTSADTRLSLTRFGQTSQQQILASSVEDLAGALLEFTTEARLGPEPMFCRGEVAGRHLRIERSAGGKTVTDSLPWSEKILGFSGVDQSLADQPMQAGESRQLSVLMPMLNDVLVADVDLTARDYVSTPLLTGEYELLEIVSSTAIPGGQPMESLLWTDRAGEILKTRMAAFEQETFRTTREVALQRVPEHPFDLGFDSIVRIDDPLDDPHAADRIRYRIELDDGDPAGVFINGGTQSTRLLGPHAIELTVERRRPGDNVDRNSEPPPGSGDLKPNGLIQSDNAKVLELADEAAGEETDPWKTALALERFVNGYITQKGFSHAFATAAEVAAEPEGDCTEHAVLLAALARARGIPARVAIGLVYIGSPAGFGFHMWDEVYIDGEWIPLDATLGRGGIGAGHIKLAHSNLSDSTALGCFLPVAQVLGRLKIEVLEVE